MNRDKRMLKNLKLQRHRKPCASTTLWISNLPDFRKTRSTPPFVRHGIAVVRSILSCNHARFFDLYENSPVHLLTSCHSRLIMEPLVAWVRQQTLIMWSSTNRKRGPGPCLCPSSAKLLWVLDELYSELSDESQRQAAEAHVDIESLGIHLGKLTEEPAEEYILPQKSNAKFKIVPLVDMATALCAVFGRIRLSFMLDDTAGHEE